MLSLTLRFASSFRLLMHVVFFEFTRQFIAALRLHVYLYCLPLIRRISFKCLII